MPNRIAETVPLNLASMMRANRVTIRTLSEQTGLTMKRIREIRAMSRVPYTVYCDLYQAASGANVFDRARYDATAK